MERRTCEVREQKSHHGQFNAGRNKPRFLVHLFYMEMPLKLPAIELFSLYSQAWESSCLVLMSRHIWETKTFWNRMDLVKRSAALCIFLKAFLWKLLVVVNKVIVILKENLQRGENRCKHVTLIWTIKHVTLIWTVDKISRLRINCDISPLSIRLWWGPDFRSPCSWRACSHLSSEQRKGFSSTKLLTTVFLFL